MNGGVIMDDNPEGNLERPVNPSMLTYCGWESAK